jgi:N-acetylneuraminic acid mutarotase
MWYLRVALGFGMVRTFQGVLANGQVLVFGGETLAGSHETAELYDAASDKWTTVGSALHARTRHTATLLKNGKVLVAGGVTNGPTVLGSAELFDPTTASWSPAGSMSQSRESQTATLLGSGNVLVAGGDDGFSARASSEQYSPGLDTWSSAGSMRDSRNQYLVGLEQGRGVSVHWR